MPTLNCEISESLMQALRLRQARTGEPLGHIVMSALADAQEVEHSTLFQVSTSTALVQGVYDGVVTISQLKEHGDFGLGTFDGLDGEMLAPDGRFNQVRGSGMLSEPGNDAKVPFAVVTAFRPEREFAIDRVNGFEELVARPDGERRTWNLFDVARSDGRFARMRTRAACKAAPGVTLVGFWTPTYAKSLNISGWYPHFITAARDGGGHLLDCRSPRAGARTGRYPLRHAGNRRLAALRPQSRSDSRPGRGRARRTSGIGSWRPRPG